jgi:hypothetical protein
MFARGASPWSGVSNSQAPEGRQCSGTAAPPGLADLLRSSRGLRPWLTAVAPSVLKTGNNYYFPMQNSVLSVRMMMAPPLTAGVPRISSPMSFVLRISAVRPALKTVVNPFSAKT